MSLREVRKDRLRERAAVGLVEAHIPLPDPGDPLKFWTEHPFENTLIDLTVFARGQSEDDINYRHEEPFTGRSGLIRQLVPAIRARLTGAPKGSADNLLTAIRHFWRLLDFSEQNAARVGHSESRVDDVRQLTETHATIARGETGRQPIPPGYFTSIRLLCNVTLKALNLPQLYWATPERCKPIRQLPPDQDCRDLRVRLKQEWDSVLRAFALMSRMRTTAFRPTNENEATLFANWLHMAEVQTRTGKPLPTAIELRGGLGNSSFRAKTGLSVTQMRLAAFPNRWKAEVAFHCALMTSGWNPATLFSLDASTADRWLLTHPRDPSRFLLIGTKARAGGNEQPVEGLWKTRCSAGYIVKTWLEWTAPLRVQLQEALAEERRIYEQMTQDENSNESLTAQLQLILKLEEGCRSVWLFAGEKGAIEWLSPRAMQCFGVNGKHVQFLTAFLFQFNQERKDRGIDREIPHCTPSDFRDMFALFVWRLSGGNLFAVMRALNHARMRTAQGYTDHKLLNVERDEAVRRFANNLFSLLQDQGGFDLTLLTHLQRYGPINDESAQRFKDYRMLQRSRISVGCKDPFHPPTSIQSVPSGKVCRQQRCLLCPSHAVIMADSLSGIAMRVEELLYTQSALPVLEWTDSLATELANGLSILSVFPEVDARDMRNHWHQAINRGQHRVPGMPPQS